MTGGEMPQIDYGSEPDASQSVVDEEFTSADGEVMLSAQLSRDPVQRVPDGLHALYGALLNLRILFPKMIPTKILFPLLAECYRMRLSRSTKSDVYVM